MKKPQVIVLLSSYNGEKYIKEQIDSILIQENVDIKLIIRDDGSSDNTINILKQYETCSNCTIIYGKNIGASNSFLWLISNTPTAEYYSFCDQDDIWDCDKLAIAVKTIKKTNAVLYHGLAGRVDKFLNKLPDMKYKPKDTFGASLLTSGTGCTMIFTNDLMKILKEYQPKSVSMHDAWVYRVCYALGYPVHYDKISHMKYRQHENNVSGGQLSIRKKVEILIKNKGLKYKDAQEIKTGFWNYMPEENKLTLTKFLNYRLSIKGKVKVLFSNDFNQYKFKTNLQNKILFLINMI